MQSRVWFAHLVYDNTVLLQNINIANHQSECICVVLHEYNTSDVTRLENVAADHSAQMTRSRYCQTNQAARSPPDINRWGDGQTFPKAVQIKDQSPDTSDQFLKTQRTCRWYVHEKFMTVLPMIWMSSKGNKAKICKSKRRNCDHIIQLLTSKCIYCTLMNSQHEMHNNTMKVHRVSFDFILTLKPRIKLKKKKGCNVVMYWLHIMHTNN